MELTKNAYAKINLTLDLTGVLPNGYHGIFTAMQTVSLADEVRIKKLQTPEIIISSNKKNIPLDMSNTAFKAAKLFFEETQKKDGAEIYIQKNIPSEAGLAGGSADAAAVLSLLNEMYDFPLSEKQLLEIAVKIGADVPFCVRGSTQLCQNIGEVMSALPDFKSYVVIAKPEEGVSTKEAFSRFDNASELKHPDNQSFLFYAANGDYKNALCNAFNIFELLTDVKQGQYIKDAMNKNGAFYSSMSGSGSSYFGLFDSLEKAKECENELRENVYFTCVCETVNRKN